MGTPDFAVASLRRLVEDGHEVVGVFTQPDKPKNRGMKLTFSPVKEYALTQDLPVYQPLKMRDGEALGILRELAPELIEGVLRQGHKMLIAGPSKAGKSFSLIEMSIAIAEGKKWLEWNCTQGKVLYVNLELDRASCLHRFRDVYEAMGLQPNNLQNIDIWNLRGKTVPMDKLAPKLIRRSLKKGYIAVIIDPIYKVLTGDENSADQMAHFTNQFDKVATELGCSVIYCHHHSKVLKGARNQWTGPVVRAYSLEIRTP